MRAQSREVGGLEGLPTPPALGHAPGDPGRVSTLRGGQQALPCAPHRRGEIPGFTVWMTGLSGAGKSTIAGELVRALRARGLSRIEVLDGDEVRTTLSAGTGFSKADRDANIRRIAYVGRLLTRNAVAVVVAAISPYRAVRDEARAMIGRFVEVHVDAPLDVVEARDVKGLYRRARAGEMPNFTGISDPYEPPVNAEVVCRTDRETVIESAAKVLHALEARGFVPPSEDDLSPAEELAIRERLTSLGYLR